MVQVRQLEYQANGLALRGTLAVPDGAGPFPGVLIGHEGPGLDDIQRARAADIAQLGYIGLALDYHGQHSPFTDRSAMMARLDHLSAHPDETRALGTAALDALLAEPAIDRSRVAAIGYAHAIGSQDAIPDTLDGRLIRPTVRGRARSRGFQLRDELLWRDKAIGLFDDRGGLTPVDLVVV